MDNHKIDPEVFAHLEWIGFIRPTGLVVSAPAMVRAGAILDRRDTEGQRLLRTYVEERIFDPKVGAIPYLPDFRMFAESVLGWGFSPKGYAGTQENPIPSELEVPLPDYGETLRPDFAVRELDPKNDGAKWQLLVRVLNPGEDFDRITHGDGKLEASPHGRMERLLRQTGIRAGLLVNGTVLRLISAPRGESSGWMDFRVADMIQTAGRPICTALRLLLGQERLLALPSHQRLTALLDDSRKFQNEVSERLAEQVLHALYELLRGFQSAHDASKGELLRAQLAEHPDEIYRGLLTVILRLIFLLYAEERDMLPEDETFLRYYSLASLYERLREDAALFPDTMDQRYGAWAQLIVLFRMVYDGAESDALKLPKRHGVLFDPDRFAFLEGRTAGVLREAQECMNPPLVPDGTIYRAFEKLLVLDGERISYRALDVEQIGSVYQTMMGFKLESATGRSVAIKAQKKFGAPTTIDLEALLGESAAKREKWFQDRADRKLTDRVKKTVKDAETLEDLHAALLPVIDHAATPDLVPQGALVLQPSEERRRSGSHYTPRELTEPIVRTTLAPILARLRGADGRPPRPEQILDLKVCDPAMGSGAFLVEACRQLGDALVDSWRFYGEMPAIPTDEDEIIFARRLVAQRCIYGVDRNPMAVDLAKVSLWLVTLAKDHPLTFLDHALRHGDSLVGLSRKQIEAFHWNPDAPRFQAGFEAMQVREHLEKVSELRKQIREAKEDVSDAELQILWEKAGQEIDKVRLMGDLVVAAYFEGETDKERESKRLVYTEGVVKNDIDKYRNWVMEWRYADRPLVPFHWEIEFPEVFERENPGLDVIIGNPPFLGGKRISTVLGMLYFEWLTMMFPPSRHLCDLVAYFFHRVYNLLRPYGTFGLIATNTISQGDTREGGLRTILQKDGQIYAATRRFKWPGSVSVVVSVIHVAKKYLVTPVTLDGKQVSRISAYLTKGLKDDSPARLSENPYFSVGSQIYGQGFLFADDDPECTPINVREELIQRSADIANRIQPYIGGEEILSSPKQMYHRYVILLSDIQSESELDQWPELRDIVREKVKPVRDVLGNNPNNVPLKRKWWAFQAHRPELYKRLSAMQHVLVTSRVNPRFGFAMMPANWIFSEAAVVFCIQSYSGFGIIQSNIHELWARFFSSTALELMRYAPSDCFETFPFPKDWDTRLDLEDISKAYYEFRATLLIKHNEGLTKTYNRFHNPDERDPDILKLRELHGAMDHAVLDAYGWNDISTACDFFLDYEIDEEEWGDKKKPYRYRWPDEVRDEVLARLLELNAERAKAEAIAGAVKAAEEAKKKPVKAGKKKKIQGMEDMFS